MNIWIKFKPVNPLDTSEWAFHRNAKSTKIMRSVLKFMYQHINLNTLFPWTYLSGHKIRLRIVIFLLISQPKHMLWILKIPSRSDGSFEHPKHA